MAHAQSVLHCVYVDISQVRMQAASFLELATLEGHTAGVQGVAVSGDSQLIASSSEDKSIRIWDVATARCKHTLEEHQGWVTCVDFSPDDTLLASGSHDNTVKIWELVGGAAPTVLRTLEGHTDFVKDIEFSPDGKRLASASCDMKMIIWDTQSGKKLLTCCGHDGWTYCLAWSPDGKHVASGGMDGCVQLWSADHGALVTPQSLRGHKGIVFSLAFGAVARGLLASCGEDRNIILRNLVEEGEEVKGTVTRTLRGHKSGVVSIALSPDDVYVASASWDKTVLLWEVATGQLLREMQRHTGEVLVLAWLRNGECIVSGSKDKTLRTWGVALKVCCHVYVLMRPNTT